MKVKKVKYFILILITIAYSCKLKSQNEEIKYEEFSFATYDNEPVFEDEYLYEIVQKKCLIENVNGIEIYNCDWNNNGKYRELGIDYLGVKSKLEKKPTLIKFDTLNCIKINGINYEYTFDGKNSKLKKASNVKESKLSLITKLTPIELENGKTYYPKIKSDSTVIYFWATWCRPCVETLKNIEVTKLEKQGINFIPIAYNCSETYEFLEKNNLNFEDLIISEKSAKAYNINSLSKQYTFLKNGDLSDKNVNLDKYYH